MKKTVTVVFSIEGTETLSVLIPEEVDISNPDCPVLEEAIHKAIEDGEFNSLALEPHLDSIVEIERDW